MKKYLALAIILSLFTGFALAQDPDGVLVITAERLPSIISQTAASITVLEKEDLSTMGDITSALRSVVGTGVKQSGGTASVATLSIRNCSASQVLVLVDGLPLTGAQMPDQDFSIIPVEQVERIEILKGPASSLYGANAVGGVVNIITRKIEKPSTTVKLGANSFKTYQSNFLYETWGEKFDWSLAGSASKGQDHRPDTEFQKGNLWAKIQMPLADMILTGTFNHYQDDKNIPTPPLNQGDPWGRANQKDREERLTLNLKADAFTANILYRDYWQKYEGWSLSKHKNQGFYIDGQYALTVADLPFLVGGDLAFDKVESTNLGAEAKQLLRGGIFLQQKSQLDLGLMRTNLRYDYHPSFGSYLSPSWNLLMPIDEQISTWVGVARAFRAPSMNDLYWEDPYSYGNPELKPETATNGELGVRLTQRKLSLELVAFARKVEDLIDWMPTGDPEMDPWMVDNYGTHLFYGLEVTGTFKIVKSLSIDCGYTLKEGKNITSRTQTHYTPRHTITGSLQFISGLLTGQLDGHFQSKQIGKLLVGTKNLPSRTVLGCQLSYPIGEGKIALRVDNLTDTKYEEQAGYHMPPRHFSLSFSQNF
jgi:outer membrane cobalamin receptor